LIQECIQSFSKPRLPCSCLMHVIQYKVVIPAAAFLLKCVSETAPGWRCNRGRCKPAELHQKVVRGRRMDLDGCGVFGLKVKGVLLLLSCSGMLKNAAGTH